jgi:threonine/homoserine/homoserine lactone efflux protein
MSYFALIGSLLALHVFAWLMPGPIFLLIVRNSLIYSRRSGIYTAIGIACANLIHISYAVIGLTFLLSDAKVLMVFAQYLGAGYLTYLGIKTLLIRKSRQDLKEHTSTNQDLSFLAAAKIGFVTNILSPKAALFFTSIFASLLSLSPPHWVIAFLWIAMPMNSFLMASLLSLFFTQNRIQRFYSKYEHIINNLLGIALLIFATLIIFGY